MAGNDLQASIRRWHPGGALVRCGLALVAVFLLSLVASSTAQAECTTAKACADDANWKAALADAKVRNAAELRATAKQKSDQGLFWRAAENQARQRGDTSA